MDRNAPSRRQCVAYWPLVVNMSMHIFFLSVTSGINEAAPDKEIDTYADARTSLRKSVKRGGRGGGYRLIDDVENQRQNAHLWIENDSIWEDDIKLLFSKVVFPPLDVSRQQDNDPEETQVPIRRLFLSLWVGLQVDWNSCQRLRLQDKH